MTFIEKAKKRAVFPTTFFFGEQKYIFLVLSERSF